MPNTNTDSILWYNVGNFGTMGYAVPNWSDDVATNNVTIRELVDLAGQNLSLVMHGDDARLRTPPSINTILRVHALYVRLGSILQSRARKDSDLLFESTHSTPALEVFRVYPVPYFKVRNAWLKRWGELVLRCIGEMMQHSENTRSDEITIHFAEVVGKYMNRIYINMATELFGISRADAEKPGFLLTEAQLGAYNPSAMVTSTERIDTVAPMREILTEDALFVIRSGILVTQLPNLVPYPADVLAGVGLTNPDLTAAGSTTTSTAAAPSIVMPVSNGV